MLSMFNRNLVRSGKQQLFNLHLAHPQIGLFQNQLRCFAVLRRYSKSHEWLDYDTETKKGKVGITKYAANALGDIVHVDLPSNGASFTQGESICAIESVKTAADVYMPCDGKIIKVNTRLEDEPQHISTTAEEDGWLMEV